MDWRTVWCVVVYYSSDNTSHFTWFVPLLYITSRAPQAGQGIHLIPKDSDGRIQANE